MNLARLNHILIPATRAERNRWRQGRGARVIGAMLAAAYAFSEEGRAVILLWMMAGALGLDLAATHGYLLWSALTGLLAAAILLRPRFACRGVTLTVRAPRRAAVGEEIAFALRLHNAGQRAHQALRMTGPFLPWDGTYTGATPSVAELPPGGTAEVTVRARFVARGEHHLDTFSVRALVPLGLTVGAPVESNDVRFVVVPRMARVGRLQVPMAERHQPGGVALASLTGESRELVGVRPYRPGDQLRDLHARRWARLGEPVVREYTQEYFTRVAIVVDSDGTGVSERRFEAALSLAAGAVGRLAGGEALIDLVAVGTDVHRLTLGRNLGFVDQALDLLACVQPAPALNADVLEARLAPHASRLSSAVMVVLHWDDTRRRIVRWLARQGVPCRVLLVEAERRANDRSPGAPQLTALTVAQIEGGQELVL